jgi:ferredoxin-NADP reductase/phenylpropionate dioxygenase-like ring-hydroxylating dioxygenase large terminal subunit
MNMNQIVEDPSGLLAALDRGESLPARWYTNPAITEREIQEIFHKSWNYIGPLSELAEPGDYITGLVGEVPVVVVRNDDDIAGFVNVCRHRRHIVMKDRGNAKVMQCPYHAWAYNLNGCLKAAPRSAAEPGFKLEHYPLLSARVEVLGPWVFVNLDRDATPVSAYFGNILTLIAESGIDLAKLQLHSREDWQARANWKTMLENYLECYHCPVAHPSFSAAIDVLPGHYNLTAQGWFMSQVGHVRQSALEGKSAVKIYNARGAIEQSQYHLLWPNMTININPGFPNLSIDIWMPHGANATKGFSEQYFAPGVSEEFAHELIAFNKEVGAEDDVLTDCVQRGLLGGMPDPGRFLTNSEHLVVHFQKLVLDALAGESKARGFSVVQPATPVSRTIPVDADESAAPVSERNAFVELELFRAEPESEIITSFYLRRVDGQKLQPWQPGQFLPIRVPIPGQVQPALRTYTLSTTPNPDHYRLSIRRGEGDALVSQFLHANAKPGLRLQAMKPRGKFVLDRSERPVVLISGGVGITPMIALAGQIVEEGRKSGTFRRCYFIHGATNGKVHAFGDHVRTLASEHSAMKVHIRYSQPCADDRLGITYDGAGHVTLDVLREVLPFDDYEFYLCGPPPFMQLLYDGLAGLGVSKDRIHYESFATGAALRVEPKPDTAAPPGPAIEGSVAIRFAKSGVNAQWSRDKGSLLELAEAVGLAPAFGCRSGICGSCATRLDRGSVEYVEEALAAPAKGEVLLCCSIPSAEARRRGSSEPALVIDL